MNVLTLISALALLGMFLVLAGMARTVYSLGYAELERRGASGSAAPATAVQSVMRLLELESRRPATHGLGIYVIAATALGCGAVLWARGDSLEKLLVSSQVCLTGVLVAREKFFERATHALYEWVLQRRRELADDEDPDGA